ncbi:maturation control protein, partial [Salmonella enterica subsp. enterica serovar Newport]|nr:maturation control protein [Salmonella enterica subsp. enterica serovar Newport]
MDKKICVVCLSVGKPAMLTAAWVNDELIMAERKNYPERRRAMELELLKDLREKEEKGFIVLVDEENSFITGRVGQRIRLRDEHTTGRPVLVEAMRIYTELDR